MNKMLFFLLVTLGAAVANAAGGGHGDGVPTSTIIYQAINVIILVAALVYFTKDAIKQLFIDRKSNYLAAAQKSAAAREEAERNFKELKEKIEALDKNKDSEIAKAQQNAVIMKAQIISEAQGLARKIQDEAALTVKLEAQKAEAQLRTQLLADSVQAAKMVLAKDINSNDHEKLQNDFVKHVQAVNP